MEEAIEDGPKGKYTFTLKFINKKGQKEKNTLQQKSFGTILGEKKIMCKKKKKIIKVVRIFKRNPKEKKKKKKSKMTVG